ncbi:MAG: hypothetical protein HY673_10795 [Chloroflexi bacterium]|nr:hypothetical protein [Chloroflexota bacterium]
MTNLKSIPKRRKSPLSYPGRVSDSERITNRLHAVRSVTGLLNDFSADQIEQFEKAVKRRALFNQ